MIAHNSLEKVAATVTIKIAFMKLRAN